MALGRLKSFLGGRKTKTEREHRAESPDALPDPKGTLRNLRKLFHPDVLGLSIQKHPDRNMHKTLGGFGDEIIRTLNNVGDVLEDDPRLQGDWDSGSRSLKQKNIFFLRFPGQKIELSSRQIRIGTPMDFLRHLKNYVETASEPDESDYAQLKPETSTAGSMNYSFAHMYGIMAEIQAWEASRRQFETPEHAGKLQSLAETCRQQFGLDIELGKSYVSTLDQTSVLAAMANILRDLPEKQKEFWRESAIHFDSRDKAPPGVMKPGDAAEAEAIIDNSRYFHSMKVEAGMEAGEAHLQEFTRAIRNVLAAGDSIEYIPTEAGKKELWWVEHFGAMIEKYGISFNIGIQPDSEDIETIEWNLRNLAIHLDFLVNKLLNDSRNLEKMQGSRISVIRKDDGLEMTLHSADGKSTVFRGEFSGLFTGE
ncbi:hypothetical protein HYW59_01515 [Candidatus Kaiserbacteria bacterium]|nr:hypothetical protein [Candidatus Kaiserbacteria bacterium]